MWWLFGGSLVCHVVCETLSFLHLIFTSSMQLFLRKLYLLKCIMAEVPPLDYPNHSHYGISTVNERYLGACLWGTSYMLNENGLQGRMILCSVFIFSAVIFSWGRGIFCNFRVESSSHYSPWCIGRCSPYCNLEVMGSSRIAIREKKEKRVELRMLRAKLFCL